MPCIAKGRVAVADMWHAGRWTNSMCEGAAAGDNQVRFAERKPLSRKWQQRQQSPKAALSEPNPLQPRRHDLMVGETTLGARLVVEQCRNRGIGPTRRHRPEGALGAPHDKQVIVNEGYATHTQKR